DEMPSQNLYESLELTVMVRRQPHSGAADKNVADVRNTSISRLDPLPLLPRHHGYRTIGRGFRTAAEFRMSRSTTLRRVFPLRIQLNELRLLLPLVVEESHPVPASNLLRRLRSPEAVMVGVDVDEVVGSTKGAGE